MKIITCLILSCCLVLGSTTEQKACISKARARIHTEDLTLAKFDSQGVDIVPSDMFHRELEIILFFHDNMMPTTHSAMGERFRSLRYEELRTGLTPALRAKWEAAYRDWCNKLDSDTP